MSPLTRYMKLPQQFGDGTDGLLHLEANGEMAKAELNLTSLEIDAGFTLSAKKMSVSQQILCIIRCLTPIVLNGVISVNEIAGSLQNDDSGLIQDQMTNKEAAVFSVPSLGHAHPAGGMSIYPIAGGSGVNPNSVCYVSYELAGYTDPAVAIGADGDSIFAATANIEDLVGPGRLFEICIGCAGTLDEGSVRVGVGGGAIRIYAPAIIFGATGAITANGQDGAPYDGAFDNGGGGGGGGYVETWTTMPISNDDWNGVTSNGVTVSGGAGGIGTGGASDGGRGMDGHRVRMRI